MKANFHTHTTRCHHATGSEREYVEHAIKSGIKTLGFSDHASYGKDWKGPSEFITLDAMPEYVSTINKLKEEYKKDIDIYVGVEIEYYPRLFDGFIKEAEQMLDYMILGQHFTETKDGVIYSFDGANTEKGLEIYTNLVVEGIKTGKYSYVAHPDVFNASDRTNYCKYMEKICATAKEHNLPLEYNLHGYFGCKHYPSDEFLQTAKKFGNDIIVGVDAHTPVFFDDLDKKMEITQKRLDSYGLKRIENIKLLNGKTV